MRHDTMTVLMYRVKLTDKAHGGVSESSTDIRGLPGAGEDVDRTKALEDSRLGRIC